jgi:hypothetical protein
VQEWLLQPAREWMATAMHGTYATHRRRRTHALLAAWDATREPPIELSLLLAADFWRVLGASAAKRSLSLRDRKRTAGNGLQQQARRAIFCFVHKVHGGRPDTADCRPLDICALNQSWGTIRLTYLPQLSQR